MLERVFAGEAPALARALDRGQTEVSGRGLSLLAVLERSASPASMDSPIGVQWETSGG
jgi:hypothetical protein